MKRLMARLTKRNQVAGRISAGTSAFQVMNIEHRVFRSAVTMLTHVPVSEKRQTYLTEIRKEEAPKFEEKPQNQLKVSP